MKRRYKIVGPIGQQDTETGDVVQPGGVITLDDHAERTRMLLDAGAVSLAADTPTKAAAMPCPLCAEQGKTKVPTFATQAELDGHYTDKHPGFVVPTYSEGDEG